MNANRCSKCKAPIVWLKTKSGNTMPVDRASVGIVELNYLDGGGDVEFDYKRHVSHFATCPNASEFRKK